MSTYWKQCLWMGGIYWVVSLLFLGIDIPVISLIDVGISVLFLLFLIPMNWLKPIKKVDSAMRKMPLLSTFFVSVGWVPYFVGLVFLVAVVVAGYIFSSGVNQEYRLLTLFDWVWVISAIRRMVMAVIIVVATVSVLVFKKSVVGCLDRKFRLIEGDACDARTLDAAAKASAKNMYACKEAEEKHEGVAEKAVKAPKKKSVKVKAKTEKKAPVKKQTTATAKKAAVKKKSTAVSASSAKKATAQKTVAKKGVVKKAPAKK